MPTTTHTLPADLPTDWTLGQIIPPSGADLGLDDRYGYNYLCKQLNDTQLLVNAQAAAIEQLQATLQNRATIGPPQEYALQLAEGYAAGNPAGAQTSYTRDQFHFVRINFHIVKENLSALDQGYAVVATVPEGFWPAKNVHSTVSLGTDANSFSYSDHTAIAYVDNRGRLALQVQVADAVRATGSICYYAQ